MPAGASRSTGCRGFFRNNGYIRTDTVREPGEYAVRGGIVDLWPSGAATPIRLDFFGDTLESLRSFDPLTQRSTGALDDFVLRPVSEVLLDDAAIQRFRSRYREAFGAVGTDDPLYESVSAGRRQAGMEHWLPFYYETLETLFDYVPGAAVSLDHQAEEARAHRLEQIADFYAARADDQRRNASRHRAAVPPGQARPDVSRRGGLAEGARRPRRRAAVAVSMPEEPPPPPPPAGEGARARHPPSPAAGEGGVGHADAFDAGARPAKNFAAERADTRINLFDAVRDYLAAEQKAGRRAAIAAYSEGSADRLATVLREHGVTELRRVADAAALAKLPPSAPSASRSCRSNRASPPTTCCSSASRTSSATGSRARRAAAATSTSSSPRRRACRPAISSSMPSTASAATRGWRRSTSPARRTIA